MKIWKVILATFVIFAAGALAGGMFARSRPQQALPPKPPVPGILSQERFQARLKKELQLTAEQTNRVDKVFTESKERIAALWDLIGPEVQRERHEVYESIRALLTSQQREKFEQLLKQPHRSDGQRRGGKGTNASSNAKMPSPGDKDL